MATNDSLLLDGVVDDLLDKDESSDRGKVFELFALEQILKDWDLSLDELRSGWTDGRQDGGIDGFYVLGKSLAAISLPMPRFPQVGWGLIAQ